jgi:hypothetical protein
MEINKATKIYYFVVVFVAIYFELSTEIMV